MKILELEYSDKLLDWNLNQTNFNGLNLLVGISGVGKTKILRAILDMKGIALGKSIPGLKWKMKFQTHSDYIYEWTGETETVQFRSSIFGKMFKNTNTQIEVFKKTPKIVQEKILLNGEEIFSRVDSKFVYKNVSMPMLSESQSIVNLLSDQKF